MDTQPFAARECRSRSRRLNPIPPEQRLAVGVETAANLLSISRRHLYELIAEDRLVSAKIGARRVILVAEIERFLAEGTR